MPPRHVPKLPSSLTSHSPSDPGGRFAGEQLLHGGLLDILFLVDETFELLN